MVLTSQTKHMYKINPAFLILIFQRTQAQSEPFCALEKSPANAHSKTPFLTTEIKTATKFSIHCMFDTGPAL